MIALVDSGGANLASLRFALERLGVQPELTTSPPVIRDASHVILPGVGAARDTMARLAALRLERVLAALTQPVLGICVGMQVMFEHSSEGDTRCLGILRGRVEGLCASPGITVPHMGWNRLVRQRHTPLLAGIPDDAYFYFVHSYAAPADANTVASCVHGAPFSAIISRGNFHATQFHPERSAAHGARLLANFLAL